MGFNDAVYGKLALFRLLPRRPLTPAASLGAAFKTVARQENFALFHHEATLTSWPVSAHGRFAFTCRAENEAIWEFIKGAPTLKNTAGFFVLFF